MDEDTYTKDANLRLRSKLVRDELGRWRAWATEAEDRMEIDLIDAALDQLYRRKVAMCARHENPAPSP